MGSSQTRARTRVPCIGRQILNQCATREATWPIALNICISKDTQLKIANAPYSIGLINKERALSNQTKSPEVGNSRTSPFSSQQRPYGSRFLHLSSLQHSPLVFASALWLTDGSYNSSSHKEKRYEEVVGKGKCHLSLLK